MYSPGWSNPLTVLWHCMWGRGQRRNKAVCSALIPLLVTSPASQKRIMPIWCRFPGRWICVYSRTPWVPPMDPPVRLGVSPTPTTPTGFYSQTFWGFISPCWNPGLRGLSRFPVVPPGLSARECGTSWSTSRHLATCPLCPGCPSPPLLSV